MMLSSFSYIAEINNLIYLLQILTAMNIQKLLKKLDKSSLDKKQQLLTVQAAYKLKTSESIGTLNSIQDQNDHSFIINDVITPQNRKVYLQSLSANSKLDLELSNIQKMKNNYQNKQNQVRSRTKSIQRSSASGNKSIQKHLLKPSNTPSFHKGQKMKKLQQGDSICKNLYGDQALDNSQLSRVSFPEPTKKANNQKNERKIVYQYPEANNTVEDEQQPYQEQPSYNQQSISVIGNMSHDQLLTDISIQKISKKNTINDKSQIENQIENYSKINKGNKECESHLSGSKEYVTKEQLKMILFQFEDKLQRVSERVSKIEEQNKQLKQSQLFLERDNKKLQQDLKKTNHEKQNLFREFKKQEIQKQELELLLKDVLYRRERQKLQNSKQNTFRQTNQRNQKRINSASVMPQNQGLSEIKNFANISHKPSESKMKVQNLLQKLQIKVDRG